MIKNISILSLSLLVLFSCKKEEFTPGTEAISGRCYDHQSNAPIQGAKVILQTDSWTTIDSAFSANDGTFKFAGDWQDGDYFLLSSTKENYSVGTTNFSVSEHSSHHELGMVPHGTIKIRVINRTKSFEGISIQFGSDAYGYPYHPSTDPLWGADLDTVFEATARYDDEIELTAILIKSNTWNPERKTVNKSYQVHPRTTTEYILEY